ncbi:hypothetical protein HDU79_000778, partial [Rhizoclosmatium sp. JEL0117]
MSGTASLFQSTGCKPDSKFSDFNDRNQYDGAVPSTKYLTALYSRIMITSQRPRILKLARMNSVKIIQIDDSFKTPKHMALREGVPMFGTLRSIANSQGGVPMCQLQSTKSQLLTKHGLKEIEEGRLATKQEETVVAYTDCVRTDRGMLEEAFPSLKSGVLPPQSSIHEELPCLELPEDVRIRYLKSSVAIDEAMTPILEAIGRGENVVLGLDAEWKYVVGKPPGKLA